MSRPRIVHIGKFYPPHRGGMESHLETLCHAVRGEVDPVVVVSAEGRRTVREVVDGVPVVRVGTLATAASATISPGIAAEVRRQRPDLVHFHHPNPTAAAALLASGWRGPLVVTYHSDIVRQRMLGPIVAPITHALLARAAAILVSSPPFLESSPVLARHRDRCRVVPFGIDDGRFDSPDPAAVREVRARWGDRMVVGVGRLVQYKGFRYLVEAMEQVGGRLVLAGDGPLRASLEEMVVRRGLASRVVFAGAVQDVAPLLHAARVFAFPSVQRSEAFGLAQLEAMACGLPVVNTHLPSGVPWVSRHGESGLTVPPRDPAALAAALRTLLDDPALARRLGEAGRARVRSEFTVDAMAAATLCTYEEALRRSPA